MTIQVVRHLRWTSARGDGCVFFTLGKALLQADYRCRATSSDGTTTKLTVFRLDVPGATPKRLLRKIGLQRESTLVIPEREVEDFLDSLAPVFLMTIDGQL